MTEISNQIAKRNQAQVDQPRNVMEMLGRMRGEIAKALPRGMDGERVARIALSEIRRSDLARATGAATGASLSECNPESFAAALMTSAAMGLEVGIRGQSYLVPFKNNDASRAMGSTFVECTLMIGYRGMIDMALRNPKTQLLSGGFVVEGDEFDWDDGLDPYLHHKRGPRDPEAPITWYYAVGKTTTGGRYLSVLSPAEVQAFRRGKVGPKGKGMIDPNHWMEVKVPIKQVCKLMPYSVTDWAATIDEQTGTELRQMRAPEQIVDQVPIEQTPDRPVLAPAPDPDDREQGQQDAEHLEGPAFGPDQQEAPDAGNDPWAKPEDQS